MICPGAFFIFLQCKILSSTYGQPIGRRDFTHQPMRIAFTVLISTLNLNLNIIEMMAQFEHVLEHFLYFSGLKYYQI
jgi:hypothetical protein